MTLIVTQLDNFKYLAVSGAADSLVGVRQVIQRNLDESRDYSLEKSLLPPREVVPDLTGLNSYKSTSFQVVFNWKEYELN